MTNPLDQLSVTIGELKEGQRVLYHRVDKIDEKITILIDSMDKLPPSPICEERHVTINEKINDLQQSHVRTATIIGTITAAIGVAVTWLVQKVKFTFGAA